MDKYDYSFGSFTYKTAKNDDFYLHEHSEYEIYMFLEGDSKYIVENKNYSLTSGDIIIIRKHEMHRVFHNSPAKYSRFVLSVSPDFFKTCPEYEKAFLKSDTGNKISSETVHSSGIYDAISRLLKYAEESGSIHSPAACAVVTEILYLINRVSSFETPYFTNSTLKEVIGYINNNFTGEITLDLLCDKFFISKYHLCRIFKAATGLTVQEYIRDKRLILASEIKKEGKTLSEAASGAGFSSYSSFYRFYVKKFGKNPKRL